MFAFAHNHTIAAHLHGASPAAVVLSQLSNLPIALTVLSLALASLWLLSRSQGDDWHKLPGPPVSNWLLGHLPQVKEGRSSGREGPCPARLVAYPPTTHRVAAYRWRAPPAAAPTPAAGPTPQRWPHPASG